MATIIGRIGVSHILTIGFAYDTNKQKIRPGMVHNESIVLAAGRLTEQHRFLVFYAVLFYNEEERNEQF